MYELALFAGAGGGILGGKLLGWKTVCAVELDLYAASVLVQRQNDGCLRPFPIWSDVSSFRIDNPDCKPVIEQLRRLAGELVISGGFPCQDISCAGKGAGLAGSRSGLWSEYARIIREIRPRYIFVDNSPMLTSRGLGTVLGDISEMGYNARWCVLGADDVGAPHKRKRIWVRADLGRRVGNSGKEIPNPKRERLEGQSRHGNRHEPGWEHPHPHRSTGACGVSWWDEDPADLPNTDASGQWRNKREKESKRNLQMQHRSTQSRVGRVADGVAHRVDRIKALGNGQVPRVFALAWHLLMESIR